MTQLKNAGFWIYGLAEAGSGPPWRLKIPERVAWALGSEGAGLRKSTISACDELVRLPQVLTGSSYNVSVAAGMALMETCRQLGHPK